jgi:integrase/recombinase XerD
VDEAVGQFLDYLRFQKGRSRNTILAYKRDLAQFVAILKQAKISSESETIPVESIEIYLEWLTNQNYKPSTIARKCAAVRGFIEFWQRDEILPINYIDNQLRDLEKIRKSPHVLTKQQIADLLAAPMTIPLDFEILPSFFLCMRQAYALRISFS